MIARNERPRLARAIHSIEAVADEIVLVDTGSTDGTPDLARELGAKVDFFSWCDDFSAARNKAVSLASQDWIFLLDCDEWLLPESVGLVRACLNDHTALAFAILRQDLHSENPPAFTEMWQIRLFPRRADLRFIGRCHPDFHPSLDEIAAREGKQICSTQIRIRHDGYLSRFRAEKLRRAARLLELELADRPGQLYYQVELGRTLVMLGDQRGHDMLRQISARMVEHRNDPQPPSPMLAGVLEYLMIPNAPPSGRALAWPEILELAHRWFPDSPPLLWRESQYLFSTGDFAGAAEVLRRLVRMGETLNYNRHTSFDPRIIGDDAKFNLGACYLRLAELDKAKAIFESLQTGPRGTDATFNLKVIADLQRQFS